MGEPAKLKYELRKRLKQLMDIRGSGTELISVYIPPKYAISDVSGKLKEEYGQASNIKSKSTRKNVQEALEKIVQYLKIFKEPPENGIAIFCGNVSEREGQTDIQLFSIVPPIPLQVQFYRCDSTFVLDPLADQLEAKDAYGLIAMDGRDATLAILKGKVVKVVRRLHSTAHAKVHKGGQSARRYQRLVEEGIENYYKRIGSAMDENFLGKEIRGVIVGGPGPAKDNFLKLKPYNYQHKILGVVDIGYTDEYGITELMNRSGNIIEEQEAMKEKKLLEQFIKDVVGGGLATYGYKQVREAIETNKAAQVLISEALEYKKYELKCNSCGHESVKIAEAAPAEDKCEKCGSRMAVKAEKEVAEELVELAESHNIPVEMVSSDTSEGAQFMGGFGGIGAFLRYK